MPEAHTPLPMWIDERAVADRWGVSTYTVQRERKRGKVKAKRLGGRWKYRDDWLREYEDQEDTPCRKSSGLQNGSSTGGLTARAGAPVGSTQEPDRHDVHRLAQAIFKRPRSDSQNT